MTTTHVPNLPEPSPAAWRKAQRSLTRAFEPYRAYYGWVDAPFGAVFVARTERGLCRVSFRKTENTLLEELESHALLPEVAPTKVDRERKQLSEYFEGKRRRFDLPIDLRWGTSFQREVLDAARRIPFGACECYSDVARRIGRPKAQRAVGNALGSNPVAIVIPCHRVVATGGRLGGYTGGLDIKETLMQIEGIEIEEAV
jgi:methylated-DNA-[protein]-cysteine S-methyltransferase